MAKQKAPRPQPRRSKTRKPGPIARHDDVVRTRVAADVPNDSESTDLGEGNPTIVGVGASAGGLEAFTQLLSALSSDRQFAFVLVQHLSPQHESVLPELLSARSPLPVLQAVEGAIIEP